MKKIAFGLLVTLLSSSLFAQKLVALSHAGTSTFFTGNTCVNDAVTAAVSGDTIYIPGGGFTIGTLTIDKTLTIFGVGHTPDSTQATYRTELSGYINLIQGASNSHLEGFYLSGDISLGTSPTDQFVQNVRIRRVNMNILRLSYNGSAVTTSNTLFIEENRIRGEMYAGYASNLLVSKNMMSQGFRYASNALITNNIIIGGYCGGGPFSNVDNCLFQNNYIYVGFGPCCCQYFISGNSNQFLNNVTNINWSFPDGTNTGTGNWFNVPMSSIFVNCPSNAFDYTYDYHLQNPATYLGSDGTQIGIYGTSQPAKVGTVPVNPHVSTKTIAPQTNASGELNIQVTVGAQNQ